MNVDRLLVLVLALAGCAAAATAYAIRGRQRRGDVKQQKENLATWEGEGGAPAGANPPKID